MALTHVKAAKVDMREDIVRRVIRFAAMTSKPNSEISEQVGGRRAPFFSLFFFLVSSLLPSCRRCS